MPQVPHKRPLTGAFREAPGPEVAKSRKGYLRAALLACGDQAVLSHRTAADLWEISPTSRSGNERTFLTLIKEHNLPKPLTNTLVEGFEVDAYWPEHTLIVEIDCYATHGSEKAFHTDRERDAVLDEAGHRVFRITDVQLDAEPALVARRIARRLSTRTG